MRKGREIMADYGLFGRGPGVRTSRGGVPSRPSLAGRELLSLLVLLGGVGFLAGLAVRGPGERPASPSSLRGHESLVESILVAPDRRALASCGWDKRVRFWGLSDERPGWGEEVESLPHTSHLFAMALTPDSKYLAVGGVGGLSLWERHPATGWELVHRRAAPPCRGVAAAPDNRTLAVGGEDGTVRLLDLPSREERGVVGRFSDDLRAVAFSPDGRWLAGAAFSGEFRLWRLDAGRRVERALAGPCGPVQAFAFAPDGRTLAASHRSEASGALVVWDLETLRPRRRLSGNEAGNNALAFSPDGRLLGAADKDDAIRLWDPADGALRETIRGGLGWVKTLAFLPGGGRLAYAGRDGTIQIRDLGPPASAPPASPEGR